MNDFYSHSDMESIGGKNMKRNPKMWVRLLAMLLIASLCLAMAACSETPASESEPTETTPTQPV